jgi:hypothetical protein
LGNRERQEHGRLRGREFERNASADEGASSSMTPT